MERSPSIILADLFTSLFIPEITSLLSFWVDIFMEKHSLISLIFSSYFPNNSLNSSLLLINIFFLKISFTSIVGPYFHKK
jgi:hypothetical protein